MPEIDSDRNFIIGELIYFFGYFITLIGVFISVGTKDATYLIVVAIGLLLMFLFPIIVFYEKRRDCKTYLCNVL